MWFLFCFILYCISLHVCLGIFMLYFSTCIFRFINVCPLWLKHFASPPRSSGPPGQQRAINLLTEAGRSVRIVALLVTLLFVSWSNFCPQEQRSSPPRRSFRSTESRRSGSMSASAAKASKKENSNHDGADETSGNNASPLSAIFSCLPSLGCLYAALSASTSARGLSLTAIWKLKRRVFLNSLGYQHIWGYLSEAAAAN